MSLISTGLLSTDLSFGGVCYSVDVDENSVGVGAILSLTVADGNYDMANASASATPEMNSLVIAVESGTGTKRVMRKGAIRNDAWSWTPGYDLYVSTTNGLMSHTPPSGSSQFQKWIGYAVTADIIWFDSDARDLIELVE